ncbi:MAG: hypothetical protein PPP58_11925 [Natronomonas sp.]
MRERTDRGRSGALIVLVLLVMLGAGLVLVAGSATADATPSEPVFEQTDDETNETDTNGEEETETDTEENDTDTEENDTDTEENDTDTEENDTDTEENDGDAEDADVCEPGPGEPNLRQSNVDAVETTIEGEDSGEIVGWFETAPDSNCDVVVDITLTTPSGTYIEGGTNIDDGVTFAASGTFLVSPGQLEEVRADVYATEAEDVRVTGDVTYWPEGHQDDARTITLNREFEVVEPSPPAEEMGVDDETDDEEPTPTATEEATPTPGDDEPAGIYDAIANNLVVVLSVVGIIVVAGLAVWKGPTIIGIGS